MAADAALFTRLPTALAWLIAALPILTVLLLMLRFRWPGARAGAVGWLVAQLVGGLLFGAGPTLLFYAQCKGLLLSLYVLYIIWGALAFFRVTDEAGSVRRIGTWLPQLTPDRGMQVLLLAWVFASFLQGFGGFGVPVAVTAPILVGLGFSPTAAVVIPSIGHSWAVTFGSLGASFYALMAATERAGWELAPTAATFLGLACLACGAASLWSAGGRALLMPRLGPVLAIGLTMAAVQYAVAANGMWSVASMLAALAGLAVALGWIRFRASARQADAVHAGTGAEGATVDTHGTAQMPVAWALAPYGLLIAIVLGAQLIPPLGAALGRVVLRVGFPELSTSWGWVTPAGPGRAIEVFGHAGALLLYSSLLGYALYRMRGYYSPGAPGRIARGVVKSGLRSSAGIVAMVGMAVTMEHAGMTHLLAEGLATLAGGAFPLVSPFIGALGAFMTGSNTNSNVVFAGLQQRVATIVGANPLIILAAQTAGAAVGSAFAPAKIIVACSTVELVGKEGQALGATMRYGLAIVACLALVCGAAVLLHL